MRASHAIQVAALLGLFTLSTGTPGTSRLALAAPPEEPVQLPLGSSDGPDIGQRAAEARRQLPAAPPETPPKGSSPGASAPSTPGAGPQTTPPSPAAPPPLPDDGSVDDVGKWPPAVQATAGTAEPPGGRQIESTDDFIEPLQPYGEWSTMDDYGRVWLPAESSVGPDWQPYTYGHWEETEYGWTWISDFDWGWAPFHYGMWVQCNRGVGWAWVPGTVWSPAWVHWRWGNGYVGWSPYGRHRRYAGWRYVPANRFGSPKPYRHFVPTHRVPTVHTSAHQHSGAPHMINPNVGLVVGPTPGQLARMGTTYVPKSSARHMGALRAPSIVAESRAVRQAQAARAGYYGHTGQAGQASPAFTVPSGGGYGIVRSGGAGGGRSWAGQPRYSAPRYSAPGYSVPRHSLPRYSPPRGSYPRFAPRYSAPRSATPRYSAPRSLSPHPSGGARVMGGFRKR